jgi:predicted transcriptional regulator
MAKTKVREVTIKESKGSFSIFSSGSSKGEYDFDGLSALRQLLSKEKAKMLDAIKYKNPSSIYGLAKMLNRPFKAVMDDIKLLERFGFIDLIREKTKNRIRHKPEISVDHMIIHLKI